MPRVPHEHIGNRIRLARTTSDIDARALAEILGVSPSAVTGWERGRTEPALSRIEQIAAVLDVDVVWLAFGKSAQSVADDISRAELLTTSDSWPTLPLWQQSTCSLAA